MKGRDTMPRLARNLLEGKKLFHVMVQGINKEKIFFEEREKYEYIKLMNKYKEEYELNVLAYCMMNNHAHMLIEVKNINKLTLYMHKLNTSYAIYYNKSKSRVGYVYRDRFKTQVIKDERHMYNCILYIHNNPVKAGVCKQAKEYKFSSYEKFLCKNNEQLLINIFVNRKEYINVHTIKELKDMNFLEDEEERNIDINNTINQYLIENKIHFLDLKLNKDLLKPITIKLKELYKLSNRKIADYLEVNREKIREILK